MARVSFGIFEFDPETTELWRNGLPVRLQAQPARVQATLLEKCGEKFDPDVVIRAEKK